MFERQEAEAHCARVLAQSTSASATELVLLSKRSSLLRLAETAPSEQSTLEDLSLQIRVECEGRHGRASTSSLDEDATRRALDAAVAAARVSPPLELPAMASGVTPKEDGGAEIAAALLESGPASKLAAIHGALASVREAGAVATGFWESTTQTVSYATSNGAFRHASSARDWFSSTVLADRGGAGVAHQGAVDGSSLAPEAAESVVRRALDIALRSRDAADVRAGEHRVLLMPQAVSELLIFLSFAGFGARSYLDGSSFLAMRKGERVLCPSMTILDDARGSGRAGRGFDFEGQTTQRVMLVEDGYARGPVWDRPTALEGGVESTGHGGLQPSAMGPMPQSLAMQIAPERRRSADEMAKELGDGLLVTQFHYTNLIDPASVRVTGMTRNGTFRVEGGEIRGPVKNLRFTENVLDALSEVIAASSENTLVDAFFGGVVSVPALVLPRFCFTSTTEF